MDNRRQFTFIFLSMGLFLLWVNLAPVLFPNIFPAAGKKPAAKPGIPAAAEANPQEVDVSQLPQPARFPENQTVVLGKSGFQGGFLIEVQCNSRGGALDWVELTDPRYTTLDRKRQYRVVGNPVSKPLAAPLERVPASLETTLAQIEEQLTLHALSLATVDWEIVQPRPNAEEVTFRYPAPDGQVEILKTYRIKKVDVAARDRDPEGYFVDCELTIRNLSDTPIETSYTLQGPVGIPLENAENTIVYREVKVGTLSNLQRPDRVTAINMAALELSKQHDKAQKPNGRKVDSWREAIHYVGIDDQFFTALLFPRGQVDQSFFEVAMPVLLYKAPKPERSDVSVRMQSKTITVAPRQEVAHKFQLFCGPKRSQLLEPMNAGPVLQYGWFSSVSKLCLWILNFFHQTIGMHYAFSIMALTVVVRLCMLPITKKQLAQAERMKEVAPKMKELQEKYKNKPEELGRAMNELYKRHNVHPASGCLPLLIQLPIFMGLYRSLQYAVDLRLARFLWIDNLAGPDALFQLGFKVPWFEWTEFNLLPILSVVLIVVQQKYMMPPPQNEEQAMQYRIINVMMVVMGALFYRTQAGLMIYILTTTIWGLLERQLLKHFAPPGKSSMPPALKTYDHGSDSGGGGTAVATLPDGPASGPRGWFEKLLEAADEAKKSTNSPSAPRDPTRRKKTRW